MSKSLHTIRAPYIYRPRLQLYTMHSHFLPKPPGPPTPASPRRSVRAFLQRRLSSMRTTRTLATQFVFTTGPHVRSHYSTSHQNSQLNIRFSLKSKARHIISLFPVSPTSFLDPANFVSPSTFLSSSFFSSPSASSRASHKRSSSFRHCWSSFVASFSSLSAFAIFFSSWLVVLAIRSNLARKIVQHLLKHNSQPLHFRRNANSSS